VLDAIREHTQDERRGTLDGFMLRFAVRHHPGEIGDVGNPATVVLTLDLDGEFQVHAFTSVSTLRKNVSAVQRRIRTSRDRVDGAARPQFPHRVSSSGRD
jgi:hypothetical protein